MWQATQSRIFRRLRRSSGALLIGGMTLLAWGVLRLIWNSSELVIGKTSNVNVFESRAVPSPIPSLSPEVTFTIADNTFNQRAFRVEGFAASYGTTDAVKSVANSSQEPTYVSPDTPIDLPETREEVKLFWPREMQAGGSESLVIILRNKAGAPISPSVSVTGYESKSSSVAPTEKPPDLQAYATTTLGATAFDTKLSSLEWQLVDDSEIQWVWNISAKQAGRQRLDSAIKIQVKDKAGNVISEKQTWQGDANIEVYRSWWNKDSINIISLAQLLFGAGLTVPWVYDRVKKRRAGRNAKQTRIPQRKRSKDRK